MKSVKDKLHLLIITLGFGKQKFIFLIAALLAVFSLFSQNIPEPPNPPRLVNDFAHVMTAGQVAQLEEKLDRYDDSTSTQIAVVTIETLEGREIGEYGAELLKKWGVGSKKNHNGVVILMANKEHKITIRTGYGVEEKLGALVVNDMIEQKLAPNFKAGNFYRGFDIVTDEMIQRLAGTYVGTGGAQKAPHIPLRTIIFIVFILIAIISSIFRGRGNGGSGTIGGGGFLEGALIGTLLGGGGRGYDGGGGGGGGFGGFGGGDASGGGSSGSW